MFLICSPQLHKQPETARFCSMGHSIFSVSIVQFVRGKLHVLSETSDRVGGRDMDECLMREFAAQFQKKAVKTSTESSIDYNGKCRWVETHVYNHGILA